jgi:hypothetical protein
LKEDVNKDKDGFQVPIYVLKNGVWNYIGEGVVVTDYEGTTIKSTDEVCKNSDSEYIKIEITNPDFANPYINLDYPLTTDISNVVEKCANIKLISSKNATPLEGVYISLYDDDNSPDFYWTEGVTDSEGKVVLKTTYYSSNASDTEGSIGFYNEYTNKWETIPITLTNCDNQDFQNVTVITPELCYVTGKITDENKGPIQTYLDVYSKNWSYFKHSKTDSQGLYKVQVPCNVDSYLQVKDYKLSFNVNGTTNGDELSDEGNEAILSPLVVENSAPWPNIWTDSYQYFNPQVIPVYVSAYDEEGDFPVIAHVKLLDKDNNIIEEKVIQIDETFDNYGMVNLYLEAPKQSGIYKLDVDVTDSKGKKRSYSEIVQTWGGDLPQIQLISTVNPPVIDYKYAYSYGKIINAGFGASDVDNDLVNCTITLYDIDNNPIESTFNRTEIYGEGAQCYSDYEFTVNTAGNYTVVYTAQDSQGNTISEDRIVYSPGDLPLEFSIWADKYYFLQEGEPVYIYASLRDDDPIEINRLTISINNETLTNVCEEAFVENSTDSCYWIDNSTLIQNIYERHFYIRFVVPTDNATEYSICTNLELKNENVEKCVKLFKFIPLNSQINLEIRK